MVQGVQVTLDELLRLRRQAHQLDLAPPRQARSLQAGGYRSALRGRGIEFDEVRIYQPGDDIRTIDWRVSARTGQTHTKLFREERERPVLLLVDQSHSMQFGTRVAFKAVIAARAATLIGWASAYQGDRVGCHLFNDSSHHELRPQRGKQGVLRMAQLLTHSQPATQQDKTTPWINALSRAVHSTHPGSALFVLSDFIDFTPEAERALTLLKRHNDVTLIFIYDPLERALPHHGNYTVSDGERFATLHTDEQQLQQRYRALFDSRLAHLQQLERKLALRLITLATDQPLLPTLQQGLAATTVRPRGAHAQHR